MVIYLAVQQLEKNIKEFEMKYKNLEMEKQRKENEIKALKIQEERLLSTRKTELRKIKSTQQISHQQYHNTSSRERMINDNHSDEY